MKQLRPGIRAGDAWGPQRELLARILASQTFQRSARLRDLLSDILEHTLAGKTELLSEHSLGIRLFERSAAYNTADDNIVRASVRHLRQKLKEYFETEGAAETILLEIPKGGYTAIFVARQPAAAAEPQPVWPWAVLAVSGGLFVAALLLWRKARPGAPSDPGT